MATASDDPILGAGPSEDSELSLNESDSGSLLSDDSVFPDYVREVRDEGTAKTLYEACARNEDWTLGKILERGVTIEEAMELDTNGRNCLMHAVSKGFVDIVCGLHSCPFIDINLQDYDGNTAIMIAAQAGFITILNYILNYFPGVDTELRDPRGFTALIKAAMQGRDECASALLMHGADLHAMDSVRGRAVMDWCLRVGRYETLQRLRCLQTHPIAEQFCETYVPEWPDLKHLVAKATATKSFIQKVSQCLKDRFSFSFPHDPQDNGALDHMVRITTGIHSPLVATGCRPLCPTSPPALSKRRLAVSELMAKHSSKELEESSVCHRHGSISSDTPSAVSATSATSVSLDSRDSVKASGIGKYIPRSMSRRNCVFPSGGIPKIELTRATDATPKKEAKNKTQKGYLEIPVWTYKAVSSDRKKEKKKIEKQKEAHEKKLKEEQERRIKEEQEKKRKEEKEKKRKARHKSTKK